MLYIMHVFPFTSHLRGIARGPHVNQEYQNAAEEEGGEGRIEQQKKVFSWISNQDLGPFSTFHPPQIILHGLFVSAPVGSPACYRDPVLLARAGAAGPEAESSRKFLLFSFCPRLITSPQALVTDQLCMQQPDPPSLSLALHGKFTSRSSSPLSPCHPRAFFGRKSELGSPFYVGRVCPFFWPIPKMVTLQRNPSLTFSLNTLWTPLCFISF